MADSKVSQLTSCTQTAAEDLLLITDDPNGVPTSKKITVKALFGNVPANTAFSANVTVSGNRLRAAANVVATKYTTVNNFIMTIKSAPSTNNATTEGWQVGETRASNTYLYIAVNATTIKRVALEAF